MPEPAIAVVVLALRAQPELVLAVRSLLGQVPPPAELVVVNSGGGDAPAVLSRAGLDAVPVIEVPQRLSPGAVRNRGLAATRAPLLGFLAADCVAEPGWVAARLAAHAGAAAVAGAVTCANPDTRAARASMLLVHRRMLPDAPAADRPAYGISIERELIERLGGWREDVDAGEDDDLAARLATAGVVIATAPGARAAHRDPESVGALLRDQHRRGRRETLAGSALHGRGVRSQGRIVAWYSLAGIAGALRAAWRAPDPRTRRQRLAAAPLLPLGAVAKAAGALSAARAPGRAASERGAGRSRAGW